MLHLHARALLALHRIYDRSDVMSYTFTVLVLEGLADLRGEAKILSNSAADAEAWLRRQLEGLGKGT